MVKYSHGLQAKFHRQGFTTTRTAGELDIPAYAARSMLHFCVQCHEKLSWHLLPRQRQKVKQGLAIQCSTCLISAVCEKEIDSKKRIKSKIWPYRSVVKQMEEKFQNSLECFHDVYDPCSQSVSTLSLDIKRFVNSFLVFLIGCKWISIFNPKNQEHCVVCFVNTYPLDKDLSGAQSYPAFEQPKTQRH